MWRDLMALTRLEVAREWRHRERAWVALLTALLTASVGLIAFHEQADEAALLSATLWVSLVFAASVSLARSFGAERDEGTLDALRLLPYERASLLWAKASAAALRMAFVAALLLPLSWLALPSARVGPAALAFVALGVAGLALAAVTLSAVAVHARAGDSLLPLLLLPLAAPLIISAVHGFAHAVAGAPASEWRGPLLVLAGYDLSLLAASALLAESTLGA